MKEKFLTAFDYDYLDLWTDATDRVDWQMSPVRIYRELVRRAPDYRGVILMGSTGTRDLYFSQLAAARIGRQGIPVVLTECIWETFSRRFARHRVAGVDQPAQLSSGPIIRRTLAALDTPRTQYCVLSSEEADVFPSRWRVPASRVHMTGFCAPSEDHTYVGPGDGGVFAGGNSLRDWRALLSIGGELRVPVTLATSLVAPQRHGNLTVGSLTAEDYDEAARAATIVVVSLASPSQRSSGHQTYLNAMLQGKPVVVTDSMGVRDHVEHGRTGIIVPPDDPDALRAALEELIGDPDRRRSLGAAAREAVLADFTLSSYLERILRIAREASTHRIS